MRKKVIIYSIFCIIVILFILILFPKNSFFENDENELTNPQIKLEASLSEIILLNSSIDNFNLTNKIEKRKSNNLIPIQGRWDQEGNVYAQKSNSGFAYTLFDNMTIIDGEIELRLMAVQDAGLGILFRYNNVNNYYLSEIVTFLDLVNIYRITDGTAKRIAEVSKPIDKNKWYKLKISVKKTVIRIYLDDIFLAEIEDSSHSSGKIGLYSSIGSVKFSDIYIKQYSNSTGSLNLKYQIRKVNLSNISITPFLIEKQMNPSGSSSYSILYYFNTTNYTAKVEAFGINDSLSLEFPENLIKPPDAIYFPTQQYESRVFNIRLLVRGYDSQRKEWIFKEFMTKEFTYDDI